MNVERADPGRAARASRLFFTALSCALAFLLAGTFVAAALPVAGEELPPGWRVLGGRWRGTEGGGLHQEVTAPEIQALLCEASVPRKGFRMGAEIRIHGEGGWRSAGLFFRRRDGENLQHVYLSAA